MKKAVCLIAIFLMGCSSSSSSSSSYSYPYMDIPDGFRSGYTKWIPSFRGHPDDQPFVARYLYSGGENYPVVTSSGRGNYSVSALGSFEDVTPIYEKSNYSVPEHLPELPTYKQYSSGAVSCGVFGDFEVLWNGNFSRGFGGVPVTEDILAHLGPYRFDDFLSGSYPYVVSAGHEYQPDGGRTPFYTLVLDGAIEEKDVASVMYTVLSACLDKGGYGTNQSFKTHGWKKDNISEWEQEYLSMWQSALDDIHHEDYAYRKTVPQEEYKPGKYGNQLDAAFARAIDGSRWFDLRGNELEIRRGDGYAEFLRLGDRRVFALEQYAYTQKASDGVSDTFNDYGALFGHRRFFGNLPFRHIWYFDPEVGCFDISRAYDLRLLGDNHIKAISEAVYGYQLDHAENETAMRDFYKEMATKNFAFPRKSGWTDLEEFREYLYPGYPEA